jgi:hypothetical protein
MCDRASQHRFVRAYYASTTDTHSEPRANDGIESVRLSFMAAQQIVLRAGVGIERNAITAVSARFELTSVLDIYPLLHNTGASHQSSVGPSKKNICRIRVPFARLSPNRPLRSNKKKRNSSASAGYISHPIPSIIIQQRSLYNITEYTTLKKKLINRVTDLYINISRYLHCTAIVWWRHDKNCWIIRVFFKQPASLNVI